MSRWLFNPLHLPLLLHSNWECFPFRFVAPSRINLALSLSVAKHCVCVTETRGTSPAKPQLFPHYYKPNHLPRIEALGRVHAYLPREKGWVSNASTHAGKTSCFFRCQANRQFHPTRTVVLLHRESWVVILTYPQDNVSFSPTVFYPSELTPLC